MSRLLQRQPLSTEVIRNIGPVGSADDWSQKRQGPILPLYEQIATLAKANRLRDVAGTTEKHINRARRATTDKTADVKPGLNLVEQLDGGAAGETGFVDAAGVYRGARLPVTLDGALPKVAVSLSPKAFNRGKDGALGTMRHEMKHAEHFQAMIDWLEKWRADVKRKSGAGAKLDDDAARKRFDKWIGSQKNVSKVESALLADERAAKTFPNTELLAYVEGFVNIFHLRPELPSLSLIAKYGLDYPPAIYQLWKAGVNFARAGDAVKTAALDRLREYYDKVLDDKERRALREWLWFLIDHASDEIKPPGASADELRAAKLVRNDFKPVLAFLKQVQTIAREHEFAAHKPADLGHAQPVAVSNAGVAVGKAVKVGRGNVEIRKNVAYQATTLTAKTPKGETLTSTQPKKKGGMSLTYTGPDVDQMRWLQFIWREVIAEYADGTKVAQPYTFTNRPAGKYDLTVDRARPSYSTDSATKASPYYEQENSANRSAKALAVYDEPDHWDVLAQKPFAAKDKPPKQVISYAHLVDYLVRGNEVLFRVDIDMSWTFTDPKVVPPVDTRAKFSGKVDRLDPAHRAKLLEQYPEVGYLP